jgi:hypothetical protein
MPAVDRFADRLIAETYEHEERVQLDSGPFDRGLRARACVRSRAGYRPRIRPAIADGVDIYQTTLLNRPQRPALLHEIAFVAAFSTDHYCMSISPGCRNSVHACVLGRGELRIDGGSDGLAPRARVFLRLRSPSSVGRFSESAWYRVVPRRSFMGTEVEYRPVQAVDPYAIRDMQTHRPASSWVRPPSQCG